MKLIKLPEGYIIVSDLRTKENDVYWSRLSNTIGITAPNGISNINLDKVIASTFHPELPQIEFDLSDEDTNKIDLTDLEHLARATPNISKHSKQSYIPGFIEGFKKAQELLLDKMFSLEDMKECWYEKMKSDDEKGKRFKWDSFEEYIESVQQKSKQWNIEIEMDKIPADRAPNGWDVFPKIIDGKIKVIKVTKIL